jgi:hypothetical protein
MVSVAQRRIITTKFRCRYRTFRYDVPVKRVTFK